ncbi:MAG TPA: hypothetical protein VK539_37670 [Myxococcaceae bacterium]|nr:hypothetical protein [Myxococcaceae bacterium]
MTRATGVLLLASLLGACEPGTLPSPSIVSVQPERVAEGGPSVLTIEVQAVLPITVDYHSRTADLASRGMKLFIAGEETDAAFSQQDGKLIAAVPTGLAQGAYDVQVAMEDGREAVREQAFSVVPQTELRDEDVIVRGGLTGFQIDPIGEQQAHVAFKVTVRALGPEASGFQGSGLLRATKGAAPLTTHAFSGGVVQQELTLEQPGGNIVLLIEDSLGNKGISNAFRVRPK